MGLYNLSEFMTKVKEDIEIKDVPLPVDDVQLTNRFLTSALKLFSIFYPVIGDAYVTEADIIDGRRRSIDGSIIYQIPERFYHGTSIIDIYGIRPGGYGSEANMYMPNVVLGSADMLLESIADIKMAADLGSMMCHAPTYEFIQPNKIQIYNGWAAGSYALECGFCHDPSLSTVPYTAFNSLFELAELDMKEYLWGKMKRSTDIDTGVGTIQLKIEDWENAKQEKKDLLNTWKETASLQQDRINYW